MRYFPLFLDLRDQPALVVGGGPVAERKAGLLAEAGARVTLVAPELSAGLRLAVEAGTYRHRQGEFSGSDVDGCTLVIAATDDRAVNTRVAAAARTLRIPVNVVDDPELSTFIVPAIVDRSPVQVAISTGGASPVLARLVRERLESLLDESLGTLASLADRWRARLKAALPVVAQRRRFVRAMLEGPAAMHVRSGRPEAADAAVAAALERETGCTTHSASHAVGSVALVGAGPGDPGLLTLRALRALQEADIILHDRLAFPEVLAVARRDAVLVSVAKHVGGGGMSQGAINEQLVAFARRGLRVVRLKGGDPFVFGRGGEEIEYLRAHDVPYEIVPGVTAALACAAHAAIPLTDRRYARIVTLATAHSEGALDEIDWSRIAGDGRSLALYMGLGTLPGLVARLVAGGIPATTAAAIIENGSRPEQRVIVATLRTVAQAARTHDVRSPALTIIGAAAGQAARLHWFGSEPIVFEEPLAAGQLVSGPAPEMPFSPVARLNSPTVHP